jgi:hypothetical protein
MSSGPQKLFNSLNILQAILISFLLLSIAVILIQGQGECLEKRCTRSGHGDTVCKFYEVPKYHCQGRVQPERTLTQQFNPTYLQALSSINNS